MACAYKSRVGLHFLVQMSLKDESDLDEVEDLVTPASASVQDAVSPATVSSALTILDYLSRRKPTLPNVLIMLLLVVIVIVFELLFSPDHVLQRAMHTFLLALNGSASDSDSCI